VLPDVITKSSSAFADGKRGGSIRSERAKMLTLYSPVVTVCTAGFNIHKFYVLPTLCLCFVWISEQTAIISLYSIN
jgi:hypothetical protein